MTCGDWRWVYRRSKNASPGGSYSGASETRASYGSARCAPRTCAHSAIARPTAPSCGARVEHLVAKEALLADRSGVYFTTPHFDGYPAVFVRLEPIGLDQLEEVVVEAWLRRAPKRVAAQWAQSDLKR